MLYLIEGMVTRSDYMEERSKEPEKVFRIVEADTDEAAQKKFINHFDEQGSPYSTSYYATVIECNEVIK
jgi:hypothetical protein